MDNKEALEVLETVLGAVNCDMSDMGGYNAIRDAVRLIQDKVDVHDDFYLDDLPTGEVRIINEDCIDEIWSESLIEMVKDCYNLDNIPHFIEIDWEQTADNCKVDGKGHHFASHDGEEHYSNGWYIFRTN